MEEDRQGGRAAKRRPAYRVAGGRARAGWVVFLAAACATGATVAGPGVTWDESYYVGYARRYVIWFDIVLFGHKPPKPFPERGAPQGALWLWALGERPFSPWALRSVWGLDRLRPDRPTLGQKHPPLGKLVSCAAMAAAGRPLGDILSARLGSAALFGLLCAAMYGFAARRYDRRTALLSVLALAMMPRVLAHMRLATLEPALLLTTTLTVFAFVPACPAGAVGRRALERPRWAAGCGLLFGLALLSKINAVFIPFIVAPWGLWAARRRAIVPLALMGVIGAGVFFAGWPALWRSPAEGLRWYLADKLERWPVPTYYFGTRYQDPSAPWHYPLVMLLATTPLLALGAAGAGVARAVRERRTRPEAARLDALFAWAALAPLLAVMAPGSGRYDGERLFLSSFPFLALLAGRGAAWAWECLAARSAARARLVAVAAAAWMLLPVALLHPYEMAYYNELVGGPWGARALGLETTYWFDTFDLRAVRFLNDRRNVPENGFVALVPPEPSVWRMYQSDGYARGDIGVSSFEERWDCLVVIPRQSFYTEELRRFMATHEPAWQVFLTPLGRIPACMIYRRGGPATQAP